MRHCAATTSSIVYWLGGVEASGFVDVKLGDRNFGGDRHVFFSAAPSQAVSVTGDSITMELTNAQKSPTVAGAQSLSMNLKKKIFMYIKRAPLPGLKTANDILRFLLR